MAVYQEETGDKTPAMSSGGDICADNGKLCRFGALFPGAEQTEHQANEVKLTTSMLRWKSIE